MIRRPSPLQFRNLIWIIVEGENVVVKARQDVQVQKSDP